jgi:hypothetical protein
VRKIASQIQARSLAGLPVEYSAREPFGQPMKGNRRMNIELIIALNAE